jgi:hypothetical protein
MGGNTLGDALAARQPSADELVGVGAVHLGARWAAGSSAGLTRNRQDSTGLVDGRITVQQFPGGSIDVIDAAAQQDRLGAPACLPDAASGAGKYGQRWYSSRRALAGGMDERRQICARCRSIGCVMISGAMPRLAWPGCLPLRRYWYVA